jgi:penicillin-binding protein 1A
MTGRRRRRRARRRRGSRMRLLGISVALLVGGVALASAFTINAIGDDLRDENIKPISLGQNSRIYDKNGRQLGIIAGVTNRTTVRLQRIPKSLRDATVAVEDQRFYEHDGVDYRRVLGAAIRDIRSGSAREGASTITMQLVKNLYPGGEERTLERKAREAYLAYQYEDKYTKNQILEEYLNGVFYGQNAVGVQAASLTYFARPVSKISLPQAALLAGLPQAPTRYSPFLNPDVARERRNEVLDRMRDQGFITPALADRAKRSGLGIKRGQAYSRKREGYFFDFVRQDLVQKLGKNKVQTGGFRVYTTIDPTLQRAAERAIRDTLYLDDDPAAAVLMIDARTGFIRAMASSERYSKDSQFNLAAQALRQSGSAFKTFVLTKAIEDGINPATTFYESKPLNFYDEKWGQIDVSTYSNSYRGVIPLSSATLSSDNSVYTQLTIDVGPPEVKELAERMGIPRSRNLPPYPSLGLGSGEVTLLDMATGYAPLANGGFRIDPIAISRMKAPDGRELRFRPRRKRVFSDGVAYEVTRILHQNVLGGTGTASQIGVPTAGKTGTTDNFVDAWFVGYTPEFVTAVWVGYPNDGGVKREMRSVHGIAVAGGSFPAQIWSRFMKEAVGDRYVDFPLPENPVRWSPFSSSFIQAALAARAASTEKTETETDSTTGPAPPTDEPQVSPGAGGAAPDPPPDITPEPDPAPPAPPAPGQTPAAPAPGAAPPPTP